jgi:iron complex outermembrane receptor protein
MDQTDNKSDKFNLAFAGSFGWGTLSARAFYEAIDHEMDFGSDKRYWYGALSAGAPPAGTNAVPCAPIGPACAAGMPMVTDGNNGGVSVQGELPLGDADKARVGAEYRAQRLDDWWPPSGGSMWPGSFRNIRDGERDRHAVFGEWEGRRGAWTLIAGLRHETVRMDAGTVHGYKTDPAGPPMPGVDVGNQIAESTAFNARARGKTDRNWDFAAIARLAADRQWSYEIGLGRKTRSPGLYERYPWSTWQMAALMNNFAGDGNGYVGKLELKPETAYTASLAAEWQAADGAWRVRVSPYYTRVSDYIDATCIARCVPNSFRILRYEN